MIIDKIFLEIKKRFVEIRYLIEVLNIRKEVAMAQL